jgi:hypothetical protein
MASDERGSEDGTSEVEGVGSESSEVGGSEMIFSSTGLEGEVPVAMGSEVNGVEEGV